MPFASDREALEANGYNADTTPIDTLMDAPLHVHLAVASAMTNQDDNDFGFDEY